MNADVFKILLTQLLQLLALVVGIGTALGLSPELLAKYDKIITALGPHIATIATLLAGLVASGTAIYAAWKKSVNQKLKAIEDTPGVKLVVDPVNAPAAAIAAAAAKDRTKIEFTNKEEAIP